MLQICKKISNLIAIPLLGIQSKFHVSFIFIEFLKSQLSRGFLKRRRPAKTKTHVLSSAAAHFPFIDLIESLEIALRFFHSTSSFPLLHKSIHLPLGSWFGYQHKISPSIARWWFLSSLKSEIHSISRPVEGWDRLLLREKEKSLQIKKKKKSKPKLLRSRPLKT